MLQNLPNREHCTGCSACYNSCMHEAIIMRQDKEGFLMPIIDEDKCVRCNVCVKKCPVINVPNIEESTKKIFAAYNLNKEQHQKSASGGLFSAFANYFYDLKNGVICASAFDLSLNLRFDISTEKKDLEKLRGSKYVQSEVGLIYREIRKLLIDGKSVFFLGTPCQVAGLRAYLGKEYDNLFTVDLVCHGVPSPKLFKSYLNSIGISSKKEYDNYYFRSQKNSIYFISSVKPVGEHSMFIPYNQHSYISAYLRGWIHRESCYNCHFTGKHRQGDCTICDFWGILAGKTSFLGGDKSMGVSMLMVNTPTGERIFSEMKSQLYLEEKSFEEALIDNHNLIHYDERPPERDFMYDELITLSPKEFMRKYNCKLYTPTSFVKRIIRRVRNFFHI